MRLLNTSTLKFGEFFDSEIPKYLILSHRWGKDEVSYQQMESGNVPNGEGIAKIKAFCKKVAQEGHRWAWVDTCCIDKKSSAELSEAINSMHWWYHNAQECLVYLSDVRKGDPDRSIQSSAWFTRGWTVQELLAPLKVTFFDRNWYQLGTRETLAHDISEAARIDVAVLRGAIWTTRSVACKMSWFAHRQTSRIEDMAYSMLGIFDINMPLIYGEGWKSFKRLQIEIVNSTGDESIFAWDPSPWHEAEEYTLPWDPRNSSGPTCYSSYSKSMLAPHPMCFERGSWVEGQASPDILNRPPYAATNKSLQISIPSADVDFSPAKIIPTLTLGNKSSATQFENCRFSLLRLNCCTDNQPIFIVLVRPLVRVRKNMDTYKYITMLGDWVKFKGPPFRVPNYFGRESERDESMYRTISVAI
ncbi:MAG: hypothetical protein OHK93_002773 [Ramalina farinacea]|uniref:Heterokaryon incompatibility domain-containing protein n=1 Tax=Ramalina farinacea TaxID=258253 RepID=A0AA43TXJ6_9LECA|nr:hypothetical protein [Ramalina farinacea]